MIHLAPRFYFLIAEKDTQPPGRAGSGNLVLPRNFFSWERHSPEWRLWFFRALTANRQSGDWRSQELPMILVL
jgi:hypothetical protein